jgi:hypothetical protein
MSPPSAVPAGLSPASPPPSSRPDPSAGPATPDLWLSGPFGRVAGALPGAVARLAPGGEPEPLDAWATGVPLKLDAGLTGPPLGDWLVTAVPRRGGPLVLLTEREPGDAARSPLRFTGPPEPGPYVVVARVTTADGRRTSRAWAIEVPDRPLPEDGLLEVTTPEVLLASGPRTVVGRPGHGCYVYLCVDVGAAPPAATLQPFAVGAGEPLQLRLSDGSGLVGWAVERRPLAGDGRDTVADTPRTVDAPVHEVDLEGLPAGEWVLRATLEFDRERGWLEAWFRVVARDDAGG